MVRYNPKDLMLVGFKGRLPKPSKINRLKTGIVFDKKTGKKTVQPSFKPVKEETLDKWFSKFIRLRDAMDNGYVKCVTCGSFHHWKQIDNGHFQTRNHINTKYHEKNCHPQCTKCNKFGTGEQYKHGLYIDNRYGKGTAQELQDLAHSHTLIKLTDLVIYEKVKIYREKVKELLKRVSG